MQQTLYGGEGPKPNTVGWALAAGYVAGSASATGVFNGGLSGTAAIASALIQGVIGTAAWTYVQRKQR
ncbi:hypothetical protein ACWDNT_22140 [Streptomyces sp. NPDC000963]